VGICFIGKINLKEFLKKRIPQKKGKILSPEGIQIGQHDGIFYYTIGQRIGPRFGIEIHKTKETMQKWYVARKILKTNTIIAAPENHPLNFRKEIYINNTHWISSNPFDNNSKKNKMDNKNLSLIKNKSTASEASLSLDGWVGKNKPIKIFSRIRQVGELLLSTLKKENSRYKITLKKAITGVSEGQAIVLYQGKKCIGGGVISFQ
jgi:tRNA-specific 2-thiouridylase